MSRSGLSEVFAIIGGSFPHVRFEVMIKIGQVVIPAFKTNLGNLFVGFGQQFCRNPYAYIFYIFHKGKAGLFFIKASERTRVHMQNGRGFF